MLAFVWNGVAFFWKPPDLAAKPPDLAVGLPFLKPKTTVFETKRLQKKLQYTCTVHVYHRFLFCISCLNRGWWSKRFRDLIESLFRDLVEPQ